MSEDGDGGLAISGVESAPWGPQSGDFNKCNKIGFGGIVHDVLLKILECNIPMNCRTLYMCNRNEGHIYIGDKYLVTILLIASRKAITRYWCKVHCKKKPSCFN